LFTFLQGVPDYFEVNPTPIYSLLYVLMFGMMFGDVGAGIVLIILGLLITRLRKGLFAFSISATKKIARIMIACGVLTVVFGFVYGVFFLVRTPWPSLLSPLNDLEEIMVIAIVFGVAQIILSLVLNIVNMVRRKEPLESILGERGIIALLFYISGVVAGYAFIVERRLEVFFQGVTAIFSSIALASLVLIFLSPLIVSLLKHDKTPILQKLLEGFGKGLEAFIAFIANSVSYIRLAAFAIGHEAIGVAAIVLGTVFGSYLSLVLLNVLDFAVEGFASFIQSLRLMYYEFSTRFFLKTGIAYEPFKISHVKIKI
jgi:V/A-type H+-transporting ATPase subunit I